MEYGLTEKGRRTVRGIVTAISEGYDLEQTAVLNGLDDVGEVKVMLMVLLAEAGIIEPVTDETEDYL